MGLAFARVSRFAIGRGAKPVQQLKEDSLIPIMLAQNHAALLIPFDRTRVFLHSDEDAGRMDFRTLCVVCIICLNAAYFTAGCCRLRGNILIPKKVRSGMIKKVSVCGFCLVKNLHDPDTSFGHKRSETVECKSLSKG